MGLACKAPNNMGREGGKQTVDVSYLKMFLNVT